MKLFDIINKINQFIKELDLEYERNMKKRRKNKKLNKVSKNMIIITDLLTLIVLVMTYVLNVIPGDYYMLVLCIFVILSALINIGLLIKSKVRIISFFISIIYSLLLLFVIIYEGYTFNFLGKISGNNIVSEVYNIVVLKDSKYDSIKDLNNLKLGILEKEDDSYLKALNIINKKISYEKNKFENNSLLVDNLLNKSVAAIMIDEGSNNILRENNEEYQNNTKVIYEFSIDVKKDNALKQKNVTKEPFNIYISGIDTYGKIQSNSRSDVNIVLSVNPVTKKILLIHIPRDYYVSLSDKNQKDKLTHAGIYGVDSSIKAIESLLNIDINYYVKLNFTSLINIVDAIGGIDVVSNYTFTTGIYDEKMKEVYTFKKGENHLNGDKALAFVRERKSFNDGDRVRGENQIIVLKAIIEKGMSKSIITNYLKLLGSMENAVITNMNNNEITSLIKMQIDDNAKWSFDNLVLNGTSDLEYTYSYPNQKLYVMVPNEESVNEAKEKLQQIID